MQVVSVIPLQGVDDHGVELTKTFEYFYYDCEEDCYISAYSGLEFSYIDLKLSMYFNYFDENHIITDKLNKVVYFQFKDEYAFNLKTNKLDYILNGNLVALNLNRADEKLISWSILDLRMSGEKRSIG